MISELPVLSDTKELILKEYRNEVKPVFFEPSTDKSKSFEIQFAELTAKWLAEANKAYEERIDGKGIYYNKDYIKIKGGSTDDIKSITGIANDNFWMNLRKSYLFKENGSNHTPSEALNAFFVGPTIADCGSVMQACIYRAIEEIIGTEAFNHHFGKPLAPFVITPTITDPIPNKETYPKLSQNELIKNGNPLFHIFTDKKQSYNGKETTIDFGDFIYLKGVEKYSAKHVYGNAPGWNLLCVGKNKQGKNLYCGFDPNQFDKPRTYEEISKILIDDYNKDPVIDTEHPRYERVKNLKDSKIYQILGIKSSINISSALFKAYITDKAEYFPLSLPWHSAPEQALPLPTTREVRTIAPFSSETKYKDFSNYEAKTELQRKLVSAAKKFTHTVVNRKEKHPVGFIMTGSPGIGKTHLSVAIAKMAAKYGANVCFFDGDSIADECRKPPENMQKLLDEWIPAADLVVLDDINCEFGINSEFLKKAIEHSIQNNKAILFSSNEHINIKKHLPFYIGYDNPLVDNFLVLSNLKGASQRKAWRKEQVDIAKMQTLEKIQILAKHDGSIPAAVAIEEQIINLEGVKKSFLMKSTIAPEKVKVVGAPHKVVIEPYDFFSKPKTVLSSDYFMDDADKYEVFIMQVTNESQCNQLLNIITKLYNGSKKLIVIINNQQQFNQMINNKLSSYYFRDDKQKLTDRLEKMFLEDIFKSCDEANPMPTK